jgi:hypothetical protein
VLVVGPVLLGVQGEAVHDLREAMLDEAGGWQQSPTDDGLFGFETLQMENTGEVETVSG